MSPFEVQDKLRELERLVARLQSTVSPLPAELASSPQIQCCIYGRVESKDENDEKLFFVDNVKAIEGSNDPRIDEEDTGEIVNVYILGSETVTVGTYVFAMRIQEDGEFYAIPAGMNQQQAVGAIGTVIPFRLTQNMQTVDLNAQAEMVDEFGDRLPDNPAYQEAVADEAARLAMAEGAAAGEVEVDDLVLQEDTGHFWKLIATGPDDAANWEDQGVWSRDILVVDPTKSDTGPTRGLFGYAEYDNARVESPLSLGFLGECVELGDATGAGESIRTRFRIVRMESLAPTILVKLLARESATELGGELVGYYGANSGYRAPLREEIQATPEVLTGVKLLDLDKVAEAAVLETAEHDGDIFIASWDQTAESYVLMALAYAESLHPDLVVKLQDDVAGTGSTNCTVQEGYQTHRHIFPVPDVTSHPTLPCFNTLSFADGALEDEEWIAKYSYQEKNYQLITKVGSGDESLKPDLVVELQADVVGLGATNTTILKGYQTTDPLLIPTGNPYAVYNTLNFAVDGRYGDKWVAKWSQPDARYELIVRLERVSEPTAAAGSEVVPFRLTQDKQQYDNHAAADLVDAAGNTIVPPVPDLTVATRVARLALVAGAGAGEVEVDDIVEQTDTARLWKFIGGSPAMDASWEDAGPSTAQIVVVDKTHVPLSAYSGGLFGKMEYTGADGSTQPGYLGECRSLDVANYASTGKPGYEIISMEGPAQALLVALTEGGSESKTELDAALLWVYGSNNTGRMPPSPLSVHDAQGLTEAAKTGDVWLAERDHKNNVYRAVSTVDLTNRLKGYPEYSENIDQEFVSTQGTLEWKEICDDPVTDIYINDGTLFGNRQYAEGSGCADHQFEIGNIVSEKVRPDLLVRLTSSISSPVIIAVVVGGFGTPGGELIPPSPMQVFDNKYLRGDLGIAQIGQIWCAKWDGITETWHLHHECGNLSVISGTVETYYEPENDTFRVGQLVEVNGRLPIDSDGNNLDYVIVDNIYGLKRGDAGDFIFLMHKRYGGPSEQDRQWLVLNPGQDYCDYPQQRFPVEQGDTIYFLGFHYQEEPNLAPCENPQLYTYCAFPLGENGDCKPAPEKIFGYIGSCDNPKWYDFDQSCEDPVTNVFVEGQFLKQNKRAKDPVTGCCEDAITDILDVTLFKGPKGDPGEDAGEALSAGCGILITPIFGDYEISVNTAELAGLGLIPDEYCGIDVNPGPGIEIVNDAVQVDQARGLHFVADELEANIGRGLEFVGDEIHVKKGCGLKFDVDTLLVNNTDLAGNVAQTFLLPNGECGLKVDTYGPTDLVKSIDDIQLTLGPGGLKVKIFWTKIKNARLVKNYPVATSEEADSDEATVAVGPCP